MSRGLKFVLVLLVVAGGAALASRIYGPTVTDGPCTVANGAMTLPGVPEASGLAISRRHPGVIWSHNDSGNEPVLFAFDEADGTPRGHIRVPVGMRDWEDISAARCPLGDCLYLGDIGDNRAVRPELSIYRVPEPALTDPTTATPERWRVKYADGPHNAESMFVIGSDLFIVTRDRTAGLYSSAIPENADRQMTLQRLGELGLAAATDAEASRDGRSVVVRTSHEVVFYRTVDLIVRRLMPYFRLGIDGLREAQGEGIAIDGHTLFFASESRWSQSGGLIRVRCSENAIDP